MTTTEQAAPAGPLDNVRVEGGAYVFDVDPETAFDGDDDATRERVHAAVGRILDGERFARMVAWLSNSYGRKRDLPSLCVEPGEEDFRAACDVLHRRLMDGPAGAILARLSDQALEDLIIVSIGFGPMVAGAMRESAANRKARRGAGHGRGPVAPDPEGEPMDDPYSTKPAGSA